MSVIETTGRRVPGTGWLACASASRPSQALRAPEEEPAWPTENLQSDCESASEVQLAL